MKVEISIKKEPFEVTITENLEGMDTFDFMEKLIEFMKKNQDIVDVTQSENNLMKIPEAKGAEISEVSSEFSKLVQESRLNEKQIMNMFDVDDLEFKIFPLLKPIEQSKRRTDNQRTAVIIFLYENSVLNNENTLSSKVLTELFAKSRMDSTNLSDAFRHDQSLVKIEGRSYRITQKGILEAPKIMKELS